MPKYAVYGRYYASKFLGTFEADAAEEALEMGLNSDENYIFVPHGLDCEFGDTTAEDGYVEEVEEASPPLPNKEGE
jgi:hypothetical protein